MVVMMLMTLVVLMVMVNDEYIRNITQIRKHSSEIVIILKENQRRARSARRLFFNRKTALPIQYRGEGGRSRRGSGDHRGGHERTKMLMVVMMLMPLVVVMVTVNDEYRK